MQPKSSTVPAGMRRSTVRQDPWWVRATLIGIAVGTIGLLIVVPVVHVFWQAFADGWRGYVQNLWGDPDTRHAVLLTLLVAPVSVVSGKVTCSQS